MKTGLIVILIGFVLNILETWFFGWNMKAKSVAEAFADNFCMLIIMLGYLMFAIGFGFHLKKLP